MDRKTEAEKRREALQAELRGVERQAEEDRRDYERKKRLAWYALLKRPGTYEWQVIPTEYETWNWDAELREKIPGARVLRRVREEFVAQFEAEWGESVSLGTNMPQDPTKWEGMFYYRTDEGILDHDGGGTYTLRTPKLVSEGEWASILVGDIPEKFKY